MGGNQWNPDGYFERWSLAVVNGVILYLAGGTWDSPPAEENIFKMRLDPKLESLLATYKGHNKAVMKDPRMCLTLPVWKNVLKDNVRIVYISRQPEAIAASLQKRDGFSNEKSMALWRVYTERAERYMKDFPFFSLQYEDLLSEKRHVILENLAGFLSVEANLENIAKETVDTFLERRKGEEEKLKDYREKDAGSQGWHQSDQSIRTEMFPEESGKTDQDAVTSDLDRILVEHDLGLLSRLYEEKIAAKDEQIRHFKEELKAVLNSKSWKITKPLRWILDKFSSS